jgi:hypothetical protein
MNKVGERDRTERGKTQEELDLEDYTEEELMLSDENDPDEKRSQAAKRYRSSEKGKEAIARYNQSDAAKAARKRYYQSPKGKMTAQRWRNSSKGQEVLNRRKELEARAKQMTEWERQGLCGLCGKDHPIETHLLGRRDGIGPESKVKKPRKTSKKTDTKGKKKTEEKKTEQKKTEQKKVK